MARVDTDVARAFIKCENKSFGNTVVKDNAVYLHGNKIAWLKRNDMPREHEFPFTLHVDNCGRVTQTTANRINAIIKAFGVNGKMVIRDGKAKLNFGLHDMDFDDVAFIRKSVYKPFNI